MQQAPHRYYRPIRPAYAPNQSTQSSHTSSYSSSAAYTSQPAPITSPAMASPSRNGQQQQQQQYYAQQSQQQYCPAQHQQQQQQQQHQQPQQQRQAPQRHPSFEHQPNRGAAGQTAAETTQYLSQAALLAEAAKRAQMACVMRDISDMELLNTKRAKHLPIDISSNTRPVDPARSGKAVSIPLPSACNKPTQMPPQAKLDKVRL